MPKKPDLWTRLLSRFAGSDLEKKEQYTEDVIAHADRIRESADRLLKLEYARADKKYRGS